MYRRKPFLLLILALFVFAAWNNSVTALANDEAAGAAKAAASTNKKTARSDDDFYQLYQLLADTVDQIDRNYVKEVDRRELMEAAIRGMVAKLDPYSAYIGPEELAQFRSSVDSEFAGIGIQVSGDEGDLRVLSPIYGTPAYRAGVHAGDLIVEIDGKSTDGLQIEDAIRMMKGPDGTKVSITIVHAGQTKREKLTLDRERVRVETVLGDRRKRDDHWDFMYDEKDSIGYIRISAFSLDTAKELRTAMEDLKKRKLRGLVLDLRFNPGGLLRSAIEVSKLYVAKGRIVSTKGRNSPERVWDADGIAVFDGFPMVVLVNRYSASASEIVSACLQDHQRAVIMGERTWGKGSVQNIIELEHGRSALKLTTAAYRRPSGKNIHRFPDAKDKDEWGVMPDLGYELGLDDHETRDLAADRRQRDIIAAHATDDKSAAVLNNEPLARRPSSDKTDAIGHPGDAQLKSAAAKKPFIDRQLEMAIKYLREKLAKN
jgi:carboxyl-terminal processing protease